MNKGPKAIRLHTRNRSNDPNNPAWQYYFKYYDDEGIRRTVSESGYSTEDAAYRAGEIALQLHREKQFVEDPDVFGMTLTEFVNKVWIPHMDSNWCEATKINRRKVLRYILDAFGKRKLRGITTKAVKSFFDDMYLNTETATSSINNIRGVFSQILIFAVEQGYLKKSPLASYKIPNPNEHPATCAKNGQVRDIVPDDALERIYKRYPKGTNGYLLLKICELTGMRISEAAALCFEDCDMVDRKIYVTRQIKIIGYNEKWKKHEIEQIKEHPELEAFKYVARNPKYNSKRVVAMSQELYDILMEAKQIQERNARILGSDYKHYWYTREYDPKFSERTFESFNIKRGKGGFYAAQTFESGIINTCGIGYPLHFVNVREDGTLLRPDYSTDMSDVIHGDNGGTVIYADFNFHSLRNTFASRCRAAGIPEYVITAMLGHKNETTTEKYMRISYAQFNTATKVHRGLEAKSAEITITDNQSFDDYLKTLDKEGLQNAMVAICARLATST